MDAKQFRSMSQKQIDDLKMALALRENFAAVNEISAFEQYLDKTITVTAGRKIPHGTTGTCFWIGSVNYSKYHNWWSWEIRIGFKDDSGNAYFTSEKNISVA